MFEIEITGEDQEKFSILPEEIDTICRLCLNKNGTVRLFDKKNNKNKNYMGGKFNEILASLSLLQIEKNDGLPQKICSACATLINEFYFFKEQINASQVILQIALGKVKAQDQIADVDVQKKCKIDIQSTTDDIIYKEEMEIHDNIKTEIEISANELNTIENYDQINDLAEHAEGYKVEISEYICRSCGDTFNDRKEFLKHRREEYSKRKKLIANASRIPCTLCYKMIVRDRYEDHMNTHTNTRPHICEICGKSFCSKPNLYAHKVTHRKIKPHICEICGRGFTQKPSLQDHIRWHKREYSFICHICGFRTCTRSAFQQHQRNHELKKNYNPDSTTKRGVRRNHYPRIKYCEICKKDFVTYQRLAIHMLSHKGEKPVKCTICDRRFSQIGQMRTHMRIHTGEKPYECNHCGKRFAINGNLQQHIKTHTGERPYPCEICDKSFYTNSSLRKHRKIHERVEFIVCSKTEYPSTD